MSDFGPYKRKPTINDVAILVDRDHYVDTWGELHRIRGNPKGVTVYSNLAQTEGWWRSGYGKFRSWAKKKIAWIHPTGLYCHFVPDDFPPDAMEGFAVWRENLAMYGASPRSMGQTALSLYRSVTTHTVNPYRANVPKIAVLGGRIGQSRPAGAYKGPIAQWDLPAAYAHEIGTLKWGGTWHELDHAPAALDQFAEAGMAIFAHAQVSIPKTLTYGPLPRRPRKELTVWRSLLRPLMVDTYPVGKRISGVWTWEEIMAARDVDCGVKVNRIWLQTRGEHPFAEWWEAVQQLRGLGGYAGFLGKMTANAFFGQLIVRDDGNLTDSWVEGDAVRREPVPSNAGMRPRHIHAAETITGRVRANLFTHVLHPAGDSALSWHTDGAWVFADTDWHPIGDWRQKAIASEMDFIDAGLYVYRPMDEDTPVWVATGIPKHLRQHTFDNFWGAFTQDWARKRRLIPR